MVWLMFSFSNLMSPSVLAQSLVSPVHRFKFKCVKCGSAGNRLMDSSVILHSPLRHNNDIFFILGMNFFSAVNKNKIQFEATYVIVTQKESHWLNRKYNSHHPETAAASSDIWQKCCAKCSSFVSSRLTSNSICPYRVRPSPFHHLWILHGLVLGSNSR